MLTYRKGHWLSSGGGSDSHHREEDKQSFLFASHQTPPHTLIRNRISHLWSKLNQSVDK